jgi:hypothetical protein
MAAADTRIEFQKATHSRESRITSVPFVAGGRATPVPVPETGFLSQIFLECDLTATLSTLNPAFGAEGVWALFKRIRVTLNTGRTVLFDMDGYSAYIESYLQVRGYGANAPGANSTTPDSALYSVPTASGANAWKLMLPLMIAANDADEFETGLINLQAEQVTVTVDLDFGSLTEIVPGGQLTGLVGNIAMHYQFYEVPNPEIARWPNLEIVQRLQDDQPIAGTGRQIYPFPRGGTLLRLHQRVKTNGAYGVAGAVSLLDMKYNKTDIAYERTPALARMKAQRLLGAQLPAGVYLFDFWNAEQDVSKGNGREMIFTDDISSLDFGVTLPNTAVITPGDSRLISVRTIHQPLRAAA